MVGTSTVRTGLLALAAGLLVCACLSEPATAPAPPPPVVQEPTPPTPTADELPVPSEGQDQQGVGNIYPHPGRPIPYSVGEDGEYIQVIKANIREAAASGEPISRMSHKMDRVMAVVDPQPGEVIADIGSGTGFLSLWLLEHDVAVDKVYAVDHNALALEMMDYMLAQAGFPDDPRIVPVQTDSEHLDLPPGEVDKVVILDLFFVLQADGSSDPPPEGHAGPSHDDESVMDDSFDKSAWLRELSACMAPTGRLYVLETADQRRDRADELPGFRRVAMRVEGDGEAFLRALIFEKERL